MRPLRNALCAVSALMTTTSFAITGGSVDPALRGTWVAAKAACESPLKVTVEANKVTFINGAQQQAYTKLDQCYTCGGKPNGKGAGGLKA